MRVGGTEAFLCGGLPETDDLIACIALDQGCWGMMEIDW